MKRVVLLLILSFSIALSGCQRGPVLHTADRRQLPLSSLSGKWLVIVNWSSWCELCRSAVPQWNALYQSLDHQTMMLGYNSVLLPKESLQQAVTNMQIHFPVIQEQLPKRYHLPDIAVEPTLFIVSPAGKLQSTIEGVRTLVELKAALAAVRARAKSIGESEGGAVSACGDSS